MSQNVFQDKDMMLIAVETSGAVRQLMTELVKRQGFTNIQSVSSLQDALSIMEIEQVGWILTPLFRGEGLNALNVLKLCTLYPQLRSVRMTVLLEENELEFIESLFSWGALSWIDKPFNKDTFSQSLEELFRVLEDNEFNTLLTASHFLRNHLKQSENYKKKLELEKQLIQLFPDKPELLLNQVETYVKLENTAKAKKIVMQVKSFWPAMEDQAHKLAEEILGENIAASEDESQDSEENLNILDIESCAIIDPDEEALERLEEILTEAGVKEFFRFTDGEAASIWIKDNNPDVIIQEWKIPKATGPVLLQRIKDAGKADLPIIVHTEVLSTSDKELLREIGVSNILPKPFNKSSFFQGLLWTIQQYRQPTEAASIARKIRAHLRHFEVKEAAELVKKYLETEGVTEGDKFLMKAEIAYAQKQYEEAKDTGIEALKCRGDSIFLLNLLGKIFLQLGELEAAFACLEKAQTLSPLNIERICAMADISNDLGDKETSKKAIEQAQAIDSESDRVKETEGKIAVQDGETEKAKQYLSSLESLQTFISYMNNKAIVLARSGKPESSLEVYQKLLDSLPDDSDIAHMSVKYNMALAYLRQEKPQEAVTTLSTIRGDKTISIVDKSNTLEERVNKAIKSGKKIVISSTTIIPTGQPAKSKDSSDESAENSEEKTSESQPPSTGTRSEDVAAIEAKQGDICCFRVYKADETEDVEAMLSKTPAFRPRKAIAREAAHGVEKAVKASA